MRVRQENESSSPKRKQIGGLKAEVDRLRARVEELETALVSVDAVMNGDTRVQEHLRRSVHFAAAYDRRAADEGIHGAEITFVVRGTRGAMSFVIYTDWDLPGIVMPRSTIGASVDYHSPVPLDGSTSIGLCKWLGGAACYSDGSGLAAHDLFDVLRAEGDEGVWRELEKNYADRLGSQP